MVSADKENPGFREIRSGLREIRVWAARGGRKSGFRVLKTARNQAFSPFLVAKIPKIFAPAAQQSNSFLNLNQDGPMKVADFGK